MGHQGAKTAIHPAKMRKTWKPLAKTGFQPFEGHLSSSCLKPKKLSMDILFSAIFRTLKWRYFTTKKHIYLGQESSYIGLTWPRCLQFQDLKWPLLYIYIHINGKLYIYTYIMYVYIYIHIYVYIYIHIYVDVDVMEW